MTGNRPTRGSPDDSGRADTAAGVTTRFEGARPGRDETDDKREGNEQPPTVYSLRLASSLFAILGYALVFGAAVGAVGRLLLRAPQSLVIGSTDPVWMLPPLAMLLPGAAFLFVVQYDDATLTRPRWPDEHPPIADAWLLVLGSSGIVAIALSESVGVGGLRDPGWIATGSVAFLGLPLWLCRRCLHRPSWTLGCVSALLALLLVPIAVSAMFVLPLELTAVATGVAIVGTAVPYGLAVASPGPERLADWLGRAIERGGAALLAYHEWLHDHDRE